MIVESFFSHLNADAALTALVVSRIFPLEIPDGEVVPAVVYAVDGDDRDPTLDGPGSLKVALFDVDAYDLTYAGAHTLADTLETLLENFSGNFGTLSPPDVVDHTRLERRFDRPFEQATGRYGVNLQFLIAYY